MSARQHWHAGYNQPGCLPEAEPSVHDSFEEARHVLADEMTLHADAEESWADEHDCDDIPCPTYGDECHWQRAGELRIEREDLLVADGPGWSGYGAGLSYWVHACSKADCPDNLEG